MTKNIPDFNKKYQMIQSKVKDTYKDNLKKNKIALLSCLNYNRWQNKIYVTRHRTKLSRSTISQSHSRVSDSNQAKKSKSWKKRKICFKPFFSLFTLKRKQCSASNSCDFCFRRNHKIPRNWLKRKFQITKAQNTRISEIPKIEITILIE